ncbi:MAG TPA: histidine kinase, partial [Acidobacteriota bacterium]|nr:histidine kinase [Acidobacteriota bacterium]
RKAQGKHFALRAWLSWEVSRSTIEKMHPILAGKRNLALYLVAWSPIAALLAALLVYSGHIGWGAALVFAAPMSVIYAFFCLAGWYLCRAFPLQHSGLPRIISIHALAALLSSSVWLLLGKGWTTTISSLPAMSDLNRRYADQVPMLLAVGVLLFVLAIAVHYLMGSFEASREAERRTLELQVLAREAELKALKAQIDPHFLFNSLNSISALTGMDPAKARKMCLLLADFLRKSLALGVKTLIPLEEEIALASSYLAVEQVRLGSRLGVEKEIDETIGGCRIPPLLLQPLVENAVHHGIANLLGGGTIRISGQRRGERLNISVENPVDTDTPTDKKGIGLDNVRNRLATFYGSEARLDVKRSERSFRVEISLPIN